MNTKEVFKINIALYLSGVLKPDLILDVSKFQGISPAPLLPPSLMDPPYVDLLQNTTLSFSKDFTILIYKLGISIYKYKFSRIVR
jgi:hypothetical protein